MNTHLKRANHAAAWVRARRTLQNAYQYAHSPCAKSLIALSQMEQEATEAYVIEYCQRMRKKLIDARLP